MRLTGGFLIDNDKISVFTSSYQQMGGALQTSTL